MNVNIVAGFSIRTQRKPWRIGCGNQCSHRERIRKLLHFINSQPRTITEFDEALVKKLLESVKVCEFFLEFRFKSGVTVSVEK